MAEIDPPESQDWDAARYEAALIHLEQLQEQLDRLRSTIPSLVTPLVNPTSSKAQMFADVRKCALQSTDEVRVFRERWSSEQTQQILENGRRSLEKDGDLSKAMDVARYGWSEE